jgi:thioredoxin-dependent peroxiredoxin
MSALEPGDAAPPFALLDQHGSTVRLEDFAGRRLLVYFYPEADTPGCTRQSCSLRDHRQELTGIGADVVGISPDAPSKQLAFDQKFHLGFPLLADEDHAVAEAYGAWGERTRSNGERVTDIIRSSFLIDGDGRIEQAWVGVTPEATVPNALAALHA